MNAATWQRLQQIVETASELPVHQRQQFLNSSCQDDANLRQQAAAMLVALENTSNTLEMAIDEVAASASLAKEIGPGERIGPYRVTGVVGSGGMGSVYLAQRDDDQFRQKVAIKVVRSGFGFNEDLLLRFRIERQVLATINHPNIARLLDGGVSSWGAPYLVMEYVEGVTLDQYAAGQELPTPARLVLFRQICAAIQHAHQNLVVHRDIKPANVIVTKDGTPKLLDFGIAKLLEPELSVHTVAFTRAADRLMTPEYASPEQIRGEAITVATDVYGLGVLLYELLTGVRPFKLAKLTLAEIEKAVCETAAVPPSMVHLPGKPHLMGRRSTDLDRIVLKAIHKEPARRYATAADLSSDIERYLSGFPVAARPDSFGYRANRFVRRNRFAVAAAILFFLTITGLGILLLRQTRRAQQEAASATAVSQYLIGLFNFTLPDSTQGRSVSARDLLDHGTKDLKEAWKGQPAIKARLLSTLGDIYYNLGDLGQATSLLSDAKEIFQKSSTTHSPDYAQAGYSLGTAFLDKGDFQSASKEYQNSLRVYEKLNGHRSREVADLLLGLGAVELSQGNFEEAEKYLLEAIQIHTATVGPEADATLIDKHNLASVYTSQGNYRVSEPLVRESLEIHRRKVGEYQTVTASDLGNLAYVLDKLGRFREAEDLLHRTLAVNDKLFGAEHPRTATPLMLLGWVYRETGRFPEAEQTTKKSIEMARRFEGEQSLHTAYDEDALGLVYLDEGAPDKARPLFEQALQTRLSKPRPSLPLLGESYDHLGLADLAEGKLASARQQIEHALEIRRKCYRAENDWLALSFNHLGRTGQASGDLNAAADAYENALRIARKNFGSEPHPITAEALCGAGEVKLAQHQPAAARSLLTECVQMRRSLSPLPRPDLEAAEAALRRAR